MIRLALFDIDGTLIRTGGAGMAAFTLTGEQAFGVRNGTSHMKFAGRTDTSLVREFLVSHNLETSEANFTRFFEHYLSILGNTLAAYQGAPCPGVTPFLDELLALPQPPRIGLLTGNIRRGAEIKLRHYGLWERFEMGAYGDDHEDRNQIAHVALRRGRELLGSDLQPEELLVVGDTPHDVECGRAVGARVLAVATGGATHEALTETQPDCLVHDLTQAVAAEVCG
ncbi:MAG: HAD family hydrolase [Verrucomicrobiae bacterium]|nr:HAD family hydrolase [Verrucomicrobiae bacterium]MCP5524744.1 HAD family hydrolase [Verrucomicrobiales bacterium]